MSGVVEASRNGPACPCSHGGEDDWNAQVQAVQQARGGVPGGVPGGAPIGGNVGPGGYGQTGGGTANLPSSNIDNYVSLHLTNPDAANPNTMNQLRQNLEYMFNTSPEFRDYVLQATQGGTDLLEIDFTVVNTPPGQPGNTSVNTNTNTNTGTDAQGTLVGSMLNGALAGVQLVASTVVPRVITFN